MDHESTELNITFIFIIALVLFFTYCAIPEHHAEEAAVAVAQQDHTEAVEEGHSKEAGVHDDADKEVEPEEKVVHEAEKVKEKPPAVEADGYNVIAMNNSAYSKHKKGIVLFTHTKHINDYAITCGNCHHDDTGTPLELKEGDEVEGCASCHSETEKPKGEKLDDKEKIAKYHFEAMHANCIGCHKESNIEKGDPKGKKPAPTSCAQCHPKN